MSTIMKSAFISVAVVNAIFIISTTSLYIIRRQHREISQTSHTLNIVQAFSTLTLSTSNLLYIAWHRSYPGFVSFWLISIFTLLWILCIFGKAMRLVLLYRWNLHALSVSEGLCQRIELARRHPDPRIRMTQVVAAVAAPSGFTINERSKTALVPLDVKPFSKAKVKRNDHEIEAYPEMRFHQKLVWSMGLALLAQVIGCFTLQVMLPNPVSIFPMTAGDDSSSLFVTHLLSTYIILFLYLVLFTPIFIYLLKDMRDANGMRFDMMATLIMGIPILLLWVIFLILFYVKAIPQTLLCNLLVEFMPTVLCIGAHITSVVLPLIWTHTAYSIVPMECESRWDSGWRNWFSNKKKKTQSAWESSAAEVVMGQARGSPISLLHNTASSSPLLHPSSTSIGKCTPLHLTVEDFARVMHDIELYSKFKRFAARDLSMDCILLHDHILP
ncbi:hypothetical protein BC829DRAFT_266004 [Chytridium lagenaria]|nr:hypothetical protein BC829DRAFT_266004 [Chytridium lagenaria]